MCVGWRQLSTESAGDGEKRRQLTGLRSPQQEEQQQAQQEQDE